MSIDPEYRTHQEWLGFLQPEGLVVSPPALCAAQAHVNRNIAPTQQVLIDLVRTEKVSAGPDRRRADQAVVPDLPDFCLKFLGWQQSDLVGATDEIPESLHIGLSEYGETLKPDYAVPDPDNQGKWLVLIKAAETGTDFDAAEKRDGHQWHASAEARLERLLRETEVPVGLLFNGTHLRLVYAPRGESSGFLTFPVQAMCEVAGRPIVAALHMLLSADRLFTVPTAQRLPAILRESRKYQNEVSTTLAKQVLAALNELLRGFQAANEATKGELLKEALQKDPNHIYGALLASLMRMVFILYAEDRGLLPLDPVFVNNYSVAELFQKLREDNARFPDTMDQRYGAWAQLLTLFRLIYDGAAHGSMRLPARHGKLFDADAYPFLEGRPFGSRRQPEDILKPPSVSDGVIYRVLSNLLLLDGERLSYRTLDVEQIGSVYEAMMGYELQVASGPSVGLRPDNVVVNLEEILKAEGDNRAKLIREIASCELTGQALEQLKAAKSTDDLLVALGKKISGRKAYIVPKGGMFLQPTDERRRSGSHYTPRLLTQPIVHTTFEPIFERLGANPRPEQILELKVCDPAMGSGAFLVETCRLLGDKLVEAWQMHGEMPSIPPDEDPSLDARRMVAQRCLYGVDKNPFAVDLAKLSLWLATLAKDHPFTFLDHALRCGDSLVGLSRQEIAQFHWATSSTGMRLLGQEQLERTIDRVTVHRHEILEMVDDNEASILLKQDKLAAADQALMPVRRAGDLLVAAFLNGAKDKEREALRKQYFDAFVSASRGNGADLEKERRLVESLRQGSRSVTPFHWQIEFPEVFERGNSGFDAIVGNPPFLGGTRISTVAGMRYFQWLTSTFPPCEHLCDLVAYFFRRAFALLRAQGALGLIATNTVSQGDTREGGLRTILHQGGQIYVANRRFRWPGSVAVVVSVVHIVKQCAVTSVFLDGKRVSRISSYLTEGTNDESPARLATNPYFSLGSKIYGQGFLFADGDPECTPLNVRDKLLKKRSDLESRIRPYIGGEEILSHPRQMYHRCVILLSDIESEAELEQWPELSEIVRSKVKPGRDILGDNPNNLPLKRRWWAFQAHRPELYRRLASMQRVLVTSQVNPRFAFAFMPASWIFSQKAVVFCIESYSGFGTIQSRVHEFWARYFSSTSIELMSYTASDCFETFPLPENWETHAVLEAAGKAYYEFRAALMIRTNEGLTKIYNRFHDPDDHAADLVTLRELHAEMDCAVLNAYGWADLRPTCEFILDYEEKEDEGIGPNSRRKPWRYRWPDEIRDEVLARLLELNRQRARAEAVAGEGQSSSARAKPSSGKSGRGKVSVEAPLVPGLLSEEKQ